MNGTARGFLALSILAGVACVHGLSACANGTSIDETATINGEDTDSGSSTPTDDGGGNMVVDPGTDSGSSGNQTGTDSGSNTGSKDSGNTGGCVGEVVINEVQSDGATASDEFVELYNPAACALSLNGYKVGYYASSATTGTPNIYFTGTAAHSIPSKGYFLIGGSGFTPPPGGKIDGTLTGGLKNDAGRVGITNGSGKLLDAVAYGTQVTGATLYVEKNPAPSPPSNKSVGRKPDGTDTDNNAVDFKVLSSPTPGSAN
jgi:hypothetical protein